MKKYKTQNKPNIAGTLDKKYRRRRIWLRVVSALSSVAVFCTVYALILPAITWEASSDDVFTVNGKRIDQNYSWTDESGELSLDVHLKGDVTFASKLPIGTKLEFDVELDPEEESELLPEYALEIDAQTLLVMKMHLTANGKDLDLSGCKADVTLRMNKEAVYAAKAVCLSDDDGDGNGADDTDIVLTVMNENGQLAATTLTEDEDPVLKFTVQANESFSTDIVSNPKFTIQHYFWFPHVETEGTGTKLPFIDTTDSSIKKDGPTGLYIPNIGSLPTKSAVLDAANGNKLLTANVLTRLFEDEQTDYINNPQITYMDRLFNNRTDYNGNYTLVEVWIKPSEALENYDQYAQYADTDGFVKYEVPENEAGTRHMPERIRFTNNPSNTYITKDPSQPRTYTTSYPYNFTILIQENTVIRLVFEVTEQLDYEEEVNFFDYDITDGNLQDGKYNSKEQGINIPSNFISGDGEHYGFGNANTGTGLHDKIFNRDGRGNLFNKYNNGVYQGCTFGIVQSLQYSSDDLPYPIFANGITAPGLFSKYDKYSADNVRVTGKTAYINGEYSLGFYRQGGTYTLSYVKDTTDRIAAYESVTVDGNLNDSGWKSDGWITVNRNNGTFQGGINSLHSEASKNFSYKYQLRTDGKKLYVAAVYDNVTFADCHDGGAGTKLRVWLKTNPNSTVYTHFYDLYSDGGVVKVLGKKNGSATENSATEIENSSVAGAMKIEGSRVTFELSVDIAEFGGKNGFEYFINGGHYADENIQLLYPAVNSLPYNTWDHANAASAEQNATTDLRYFENPGDEIKIYPNIFTNGFWPMDKSPSAGAEGNDPLFGKRDSTVKFSEGPNQSDDFKDHNSYFGMSYTVDFTIDPGYCAPLEYWFYGDDDMWVFLDKVDNPYSTPKLVADIGGVHSSVGQFVNLWDYVDPIPLRDENGNENTASEKYRLTIFYTERGAAGSTCYMRFTVPLDTHTTPAPEREEALMFEKVLNDGTDGQENVTSDEEFEFLLTLTNEDGTPFYDLYDYAIYNRADTPDHKAADAIAVEEGVIGLLIPESGKYTFKLKGGQYILITNLPDNTYYTIEEVSIGNYATLYQKGRHTHDENGKQIDTLEGAVRYNYSVGNPERIRAIDYNYVCFTNSHAIKAETDPGDGKHVHIDDLITYEIEWGNDRNEIADIVITDPLDNGLDFVSAGFKSLKVADVVVAEYGDSGRWEWNGSDNTYAMDDECIITYDEATRTVVWTWKNRPVESSGVVLLTVRVNEAASEEETSPGKFGTMTSRVENQAMVQIGNDHVIETNIVENPVWDPVKTETTPGAGKPVLTDSEIVYTVTWKNYHNQPATVTVRDPLDSVVEYISGSAEVYYGAHGSDEQVKIDDASISYDPQTHTVGWDLGEQAAGSEGYVIFKVRVKKESVQKRAISNTGFVKVGNDAEVKTNRIDNPVYGYMLPSTGGSGTFIFTICGLTLMLGPLIVWFMARRKRERRSFGDTSRSR